MKPLDVAKATDRQLEEFLAREVLGWRRGSGPRRYRWQKDGEYQTTLALWHPTTKRDDLQDVLLVIPKGRWQAIFGRWNPFLVPHPKSQHQMWRLGVMADPRTVCRAIVQAWQESPKHR